MPTTPRGIVYPNSSDHTRLWEHLQDTAESVDAALAAPAVSLGHSVGQSIPNNTPTPVVFDQEYFDTNGFHSTGSRITIPSGQAGRYLINYVCAFSAVAGGTNRQGWVRRNGSSGDRIAASLGFGSASYNGQLGGVTVLDLAVGDYIELVVFHDQGGAIGLQGNNSAAHIIEFTALRVA